MSKGYRVHVEDRGEGTTLQVGDGGSLVQMNLPEDISGSDIPQVRLVERIGASNRSSPGGGGGRGEDSERFYKVDLKGKNAKTLYGNNTQVLNIQKTGNSARDNNTNASNQRDERPSIQPTTDAVQATQGSEQVSMDTAATSPESLDQLSTDQRALDLEQTARKLVAGDKGESSSQDLSVDYRSLTRMVDLQDKNQKMKGSGSVDENGHSAEHVQTSSPDAVIDQETPSTELSRPKFRSKKKKIMCRNSGVSVNMMQEVGVTSSTQTDLNDEEQILFNTIQGSGHHVQIGNYNQIVDISINKEALMTARDGGQLTVSDQQQTVFTLIWKDLTTIIQETKEELKTKWTLCFSNLVKWMEIDILQHLSNGTCDDLRKFVSDIFRKYNAQLQYVCTGSIVFIFRHASHHSRETMMADKDNVKRMFQDLLVSLGKPNMEFELESSLTDGSSFQHQRSQAVLPPAQLTAEQVEQVVAHVMEQKLKEVGSQVKSLDDRSHRMQRDISDHFESAKKDMDRATRELRDLITTLIESRLQSASASSSPQITSHPQTPGDYGYLPSKNLNIPFTPPPPEPILAYSAITEVGMGEVQEEVKEEVKDIPSSQPSGGSSGRDVDPQGAAARVAAHETSKVTTSEHIREESSQSQQYLYEQAESLLASYNMPSSGDENRRLVKSVAQALVHGPRQPRAKGLDTILCLDLSESVQASGVEKVKEMATAFVDSIEDIAEKHNLEENIGVVAMGGRAQLVQQLTNDYGSVRDAIELLQCRGRSPMCEALLVCIAAIKGRGGFLSVEESHRIHPRIIFFTDGIASAESHELGPDNLDSNTEAMVQLIKLAKELNPKKGRSVPNPIIWVPVGKADTKALECVSQFADGLLVKDNNISQLSNYYRMQQAVGKVYSCVKDMKPKDESVLVQIEAVTNALVGDMTPEGKEEVIKAVTVKLESKDETGPDSGPYNFDNVHEDPALPPLGSRVIRGPDWNHQDQDDDGPGTVVNHSSEEGYLWVLWDKNNKVCCYSYGRGGKCEVKLHDQPRNVKNIQMIETGASVKKGPDWSPEDKEDPGIGTVIRKSADNRVKVKWQPSGNITTCSVGYSGKFELELCSSEEKPSQISKQHIPKKQTTSPRSKIDAINQPSQDRPHVLWQWQDSKGTWRLYDKEHVVKLNKEFNRKPNSTCILQKRGKSYRVFFKDMVEKSVDGGGTRYDVRRKVVSDQERDELICVELSLDEGSSWLQSS